MKLRLKFSLLFLFLSIMHSFSVTKVWIGKNSSDWNAAANWSGGAIPSNGDDMLIDLSNYITGNVPVIASASTFSIEHITVQNGGCLTINSAVTITGNITIASTGTITTTDPSNGLISFNGSTDLLGSGAYIFPSIIINSGKTLNQAEAKLINIKGNWTNNGGVFIPQTNKVIFTGTIVQLLNGTSTIQTFYDFEIAKNAQSLRISGGLTTLNVHDFTQTSFKFHDSALSVFNVSGNFLHTSGTFVPCNNITISGSITDNHPYGGLTWGTFVTLKGSDKQLIGGAYSMNFKKLIINNSSAAGIILEQDVTIDSSLTLSNGIVHSDINNLLIIKKNASSTSGSNSSFVDGPIKKIGAVPFIFHTGNAGIWARLELVNDANYKNFSSTTEFTCTYHRGASPYNTTEFMSADLKHVSYLEYWELERTFDAGNDATCNIKLYWEDTSKSGIGNLADLRVAHFSSAFNYYENKGANISANGKTGTIITTIPSSSFSPFTFGSGTGLNPLPIELLDFEAKPTTYKQVMLTWCVASELNNDYFIIERSADGIHFEELKKVKGAGTANVKQTYKTTDESPYNDTSYYRLKQVDFDGKTKIYKVVYSILKNDDTPFSLYPNPLCSGESLMLINNGRINQTVQIQMNDNSGKLIFEKNFSINQRFNQVSIIERDLLPKGFYSVIVKGEEECTQLKMIVQ